ncbi:hypothetical protein BATDEDRAFT_90093 [Batrachochytrium dendrobatidis JAM81]|uniref:Uncharacterized protein n=2 Tax=Batrachochytrium dendrobatidis TaxID=109871 RepID=F4P6W2_BATDJ|nr:uncharacterized protein BATDEDRAFT_90093 [Batrachochytrium dendrobatidis JAM81]EGF78913.1 hypothetical protein BATDEDRAFT_90093 [Batrachochytrium dendrobatidis JAM81]KAJ8325170.1 hypothetical protein O5D80_006122 [Batrachochytrium dendrobatidis]KAK5667331.1 hypothetical protein QVD99_005936 [Batrachochytrium dendrobatidis]OAJ42165.1 hypothetical protein BDEG_25660 [Batrachochytrium dendrobatidis JEL423]|eukprot:XP_006680500.1 hypothetical protein BATDEDRAFT_90093 [Batrachochytrium dendrobatidis JAM81]
MVTIGVSVMSIEGGVTKDVGQYIQIGPWTRARDVIQIALEKILGSGEMTSQYALYESEFFRPVAEPTSQTHALGRRRSQDVVQRRIIRALEPDEIPLVVLAGWQLSPPMAATYSFFIKPIDQGATTFGTLRDEQCRSLPMDRLRKRLATIAQDEVFAEEDLWARHAALKDAISIRIQQFQTKQ